MKNDREIVRGSEYIPIAQCAFCGDDAICKASDNTPLCENCAPMYRPATRIRKEGNQ